jgi:hypothetical protein
MERYIHITCTIFSLLFRESFNGAVSTTEYGERLCLMNWDAAEEACKSYPVTGLCLEHNTNRYTKQGH